MIVWKDENKTKKRPGWTILEIRPLEAFFALFIVFSKQNVTFFKGKIVGSDNFVQVSAHLPVWNNTVLWFRKTGCHFEKILRLPNAKIFKK